MSSFVYDTLVGPGVNLARTAILGIFAYFSLVLSLRISGKRTLSKLNAFDLVVTVALGSSLATILLSKDTSLLQGVLAFGLLIGLQYVVAWLSTRSERVASLVKATPALLLYRGRILDDTLRRERLTKEELYVAARSSGLERLEQADAIVLESDGSLTVLYGDAKELSTLCGVRPRVGGSTA